MWRNQCRAIEARGVEIGSGERKRSPVLLLALARTYLQPVRMA